MAGWTSPRTWVASEVVTAATLNAHVRDNLNALNGFVLKTADESVTSSTVLQNDDHLSYVIPAVGTYVFEINLIGQSGANAAGDLQTAVTFPGTCYLMGRGPDLNLPSGSIEPGEWKAYSPATSGGTTIHFGLSASPFMVNAQLRGVLVATATGTLRLQWAQSTSNVNASTVKAGSYMLVQQVA